MLQYLHACECVHTYAHTAHLFPDFAYGTGQDAVITQGELSSPTDFGFETPVSAKRNHESLKKMSGPSAEAGDVQSELCISCART